MLGRPAVVECGLRSTRAQGLWCSGLAAVQHGASSLPQPGLNVPPALEESLHHWATREAPWCHCCLCSGMLQALVCPSSNPELAFSKGLSCCSWTCGALRPWNWGVHTWIMTSKVNVSSSSQTAQIGTLSVFPGFICFVVLLIYRLFSSVTVVSDSATPRTAARQASLSVTTSGACSDSRPSSQ